MSATERLPVPRSYALRTLKDQAKTLGRFPQSPELRAAVAANVARVEADRRR